MLRRRGLLPVARKEKIKALAYLRTSSAANVGTDKDSDKRQRAAIVAFAKSHSFQIVEEFNDPGVNGADPIETRPGFTGLLDQIEGNGVRTVLVWRVPVTRLTVERFTPSGSSRWPRDTGRWLQHPGLSSMTPVHQLVHTARPTTCYIKQPKL
jgi:DNA invertase Pin-like site-specific DNA recombinase